MSDAPDTSASSNVTDHVFMPVGAWWSPCEQCGLAESAHARTSVDHDAVVSAPYRCPDCVIARDFKRPMPHEEGACPVP